MFNLIDGGPPYEEPDDDLYYEAEPFDWNDDGPDEEFDRISFEDEVAENAYWQRERKQHAE